jgi:WD40 repeat protein
MRIFLSFNSRDSSLAEALRSELQRLEPSADIFFSPVSISNGFWLPRLAAGIDEADAFLLLLGPKGVGPWQEVEYHQAFDRHVKDKSFPVIPIISDGGYAPGLPFLRQLNWVEGHSIREEAVLHRVVAFLHGEEGSPVPERWKLVQPYRGLEAMTEANADYFYGRSAATQKVLQTLSERPGRIPMLIGASGVGKSSVAQAGVISSLKAMKWPKASNADGALRPWPSGFRNSRNGWAWLVVRPGNDPLKALATAFTRLWFSDSTNPERGPRARQWADGLRKANTLNDLIDATHDRFGSGNDSTLDRILLYIDQAEELYSPAFAAASSEARRFSELLAQAATDPRLITFGSLRADYFDRFQADTSFFSIYEHVNLPPLASAELEDVISKPASELGVVFDGPELPARITEAAVDATGNLPLLSYLMTDMWSQMVSRGDGHLKLPAQAINIGGVLAARAEEYLRDHAASEGVLRRLLTLKLTLSLPGGKFVRRSAARSECTTEEWAVAEDLADKNWRLIVLGEEEEGEAGHVTAEVAHEALLGGWPRLLGWLKDDSEFLLFKTDVERTQRRWLPTRDPAALLRGLDLHLARQWVERRPDDLSEEVREFIFESIAFDRVATENALRFQRKVSISALAAAVLLAISALAAGWQWNMAQQRGNLLVTQKVQLQRQTDELAKQRDAAFISQSRFLADLASKNTNSGNAGAGMLYALAAMPDASNKGARSELAAHNALVHAAQRLQEILVLKGHEGSVNFATFSSDGRFVLTASADHTARIWDARSGAEHLKLSGHRDAVVTASFGRDGTRVVTASLDGTGRIWDTRSGKPLKILASHDAPDDAERAVYTAEFDPIGGKVVTASADKTARVWDAESGQELLALRGHRDTVWSAAFSPDGQQIVTASQDGTACIWNAASGTSIVLSEPAQGDAPRIRSCAEGEDAIGHQDSVVSAKYSRDGKYVITASRDWSAIVWDATTGLLVARLSDAHQRPVTNAEFSPDGLWVVASAGSPSDSTDNTAIVWDTQAWKPVVLGQTGEAYKSATEGGMVGSIRGHLGEVRSASFSSNGDRVVTASEDGTARIWDPASGKELTVFRGHTKAVLGATFSPDRKRVVTASADGTARIWNADKESPTTKFDMFVGHNSGVLDIAFSADGRRLATASEDCTGRLWDAKTGEVFAKLDHGDTVRRIAFSKDGRFVVTASEDTTARIWDATSREWDADYKVWKGKLLATLGTMPPYDDLTCSVHGDDETKPGHTDAVWSAAFSPDGRRVITASDDGTARLWDVGRGEQIAVLAGHDDAVISASFSPDGKRIVSASRDTTARVWDAETGGQLLVLSGHDRELNDAAFSSSGLWIATAAGGSEDPRDNRDNTARVWNAETGEERLVLKGHDAPVSHVSFSPDNRYLLSASVDGTARIWNAISGAPVAVLRGHSLALTAARFSFDASAAVTSSKDGTARIWNTRNMDNPELTAILSGHDGAVWNADFSPDGQTVITSGQDGSIHLWDATSGHLLVSQVDHSQKVVTYSGDGQKLLTAATNGNVRVWDAAAGREAIHFATSDSLRTAAFVGGDRQVVAISDCKRTDIDYGDSEGCTKMGDTSDQAGGNGGGDDSPGNNGDNSADDTKDSKEKPGMGLPWLAGSSVVVRVWDMISGGAIPPNLQSQEAVQLSKLLLADAFSPDHSRVVAIDVGEGSADLWDPEAKVKISALKGHSGEITAAVFSPDSKTVLTISGDRTVGIWDAKTGQSLGFLKGHEGPIISAAFSADGRRVVTTAGGRDVTDQRDNTARIWEVSTARQVAVLRGHSGPVRSAAFSPDGRRLITSSSDRTARLWNAETSEQLHVLAHPDDVLDAKFSPDGAQVLTSSADGVLRLWDPISGRITREMNRKGAPDELSIGDEKGCGENDIDVRVNCARLIAPRCLTSGEMEAAYLSVIPPEWCVRLKKWPYHTQVWQLWLKFLDEKAAPPLPDSPSWERFLARSRQLRQ